MPPVVTRELSFTYAGVAVGGSSAIYLLHGNWTYARNYDQITLSCNVVCVGDSEANFKSNLASLNAAFRKPRQALTVVLGSQTMETYSHSGNTGYNAYPSIAKLPSPINTARSQMCLCTVTMQLPADLTGQNGLRNASVNVTKFATGQRQIVISGTYTALSANSARAQYEASADSYCNTWLDGFGGNANYEMLPDSATHDDPNKNLTFTRTYLEVIFNQAGGVLNNAAIKNPRVMVTRSREGIRDSDPSVVKAVPLIVSYGCDVDKDQTTDLEGLYEGTIKPYLITYVQDVTGISNVSLLTDEPQFIPAANSITARLLFRGYEGNLIMATTTTTEEDDRGKIVVPVWDGNAYSKWTFQGPANRFRTVTQHVLELTGSGGEIGDGGGGLSPVGEGRGGTLLPSTQAALNVMGAAASIATGGLGLGMGVGDLFTMDLRNLNFSFSGSGSGTGGSKRPASISKDSPSPSSSASAGRWLVLNVVPTEEPFYEGMQGYQVRLLRKTKTIRMMWIVEPSGG